MGAIAQRLPGMFSADECSGFLKARPDEERWQLIDELPELSFRCALRDLYRGTPLA
jgi:hypothetical protein